MVVAAAAAAAAAADSLISWAGNYSWVIRVVFALAVPSLLAQLQWGVFPPNKSAQLLGEFQHRLSDSLHPAVLRKTQMYHDALALNPRSVASVSHKFGDWP